MNTPSVNAVHNQLLIRKPVDIVFQAFVDPEVTTQFWFTHSTGKLEKGQTFTWEWRMYGLKVPVHVLELDLNERIVIDWGDGEDRSSVEWTFESRDEGTVVNVSSYGFSGTPEQVIDKLMDSKGGFTLVLANAKARLEHDIDLNLILDSHP